MKNLDQISWGNHPARHDCDQCRAFREQLANAKTVAGDRVAVKMDLTTAETSELDGLAASLGVTRKAAAEILFREMLSKKGRHR